ncbi:MAG TPA: hypothetical protein PKC43_10210 [Phycisphaerales bacterium]|mgnify:CR=1 FL=1|nr:hypothetical protein [Phycisphaerales bacterium]HMP37809.1 hypothetical protein [Phycisphaerales bacterium]
MATRGLTIIELLLATMVLSVAVALAAASAARSTGGDPVRRAAALARDLDARARLLARHEGELMILVESAHRRVVARDRHGSLLLTIDLPDSIECELRSVAGDAGLLLDSRGQSMDAVLRLVGVDRSLSLRVLGLSGQWIEEGP